MQCPLSRVKSECTGMRCAWWDNDAQSCCILSATRAVRGIARARQARWNAETGSETPAEREGQEGMNVV